MNKITPSQSRSFAALVQQFFTEYLVKQRAVSPCTVASYRDAMMLFLHFVHQHLGKQPTALKVADVTPELILAFLDHLEQQRHNTVRSRNLRLTALRAFLKFAARRDLDSFHLIEQALNIPMKRYERPILGFLSRDEMLAVIGKPGTTWTAQRDHLLLTLLYNTGARVSEIIDVQVADVVLEGAVCVHLRGKGRKLRSVPLWKSTVEVIRNWLKSNPALRPGSALIPNRHGQAMTRSNVTQRLEVAVSRASKVHSSLATRRISPHSVRHTTAMHLLQSGVDFSVIALWLGHESATTTHRYVEANLAMKDKALARLQEPDTPIQRYRPPDTLMQFLQTL